MSELLSNIGTTEQDNLIAKIFPPAEVTGVTIAKGEAETTYKRGTVLAADAEGKCAIMNTGLSPAYILAEDVTVGTDADAAAVAYRTGCFNAEAVTVADSYELSVADKDALRKYGIVFVDKML